MLTFHLLKAWLPRSQGFPENKSDSACLKAVLKVKHFCEDVQSSCRLEMILCLFVLDL